MTSKAVKQKADKQCPICKKFNDRYLSEKRKSNEYASKLRGFQAKIDAEIETRKEIEKNLEHTQHELEIELAGRDVLAEENKLNDIRILDYKKEVSDLKREKQQLLTELEQHKEKEIEFDLTEDKFEHSVDSYKNQIADLNSEIDRLNKANTIFQDTVNSKDFIIEHKTGRLADIIKELRNKTQENADNEERIGRLREIKEKNKNEIEKLNTNAAIKEREFIDLREKHGDLQDAHKKLQIQYDVVERNLKGLKYFKQEEMIEALLARLDERLAKAKIYSLWDETRNTRQKNKQFYDAVMEELERQKQKAEEQEKPEPTFKEKLSAWYKGEDLFK